MIKSILVSIISLAFNYEYLCLLSCYLLHIHQTMLNVQFGEGALVSSKSRVSNTTDNSSVKELPHVPCHDSLMFEMGYHCAKFCPLIPSRSSVALSIYYSYVYFTNIIN